MPDSTCCTDGCYRPVRIKSRQLCATHYRYRYQATPPPVRERKMERPWKMPPITDPLAHVKVDPVTGCWDWQGKFRHPYPRYGRAAAHRLYYELLVGPIPEGLTIDHLCRNTGCVNPDHLEAVTDTVNILRSDNPAAQNYRKTHCGRGHEFTDENTVHRVTRGRPWRECRECKSIWRAAGEARRAG